MNSLISDLARRIDDVVAEPDLYKRQQLGRELSLWIAGELSPLDIAIGQAPELQKPDNPYARRRRSS